MTDCTEPRCGERRTTGARHRLFKTGDSPRRGLSPERPVPAPVVGPGSATMAAAMQQRTQNVESTRQVIWLLRHCIARVQG